MPETITLLNNNIFYAIGLRSLISDYELQNITFAELEDKDIRELSGDIKLVLIVNECLLPEETIDLVKSLLEQKIQVIYLAKEEEQIISQLCSLGCQGIIEQKQANEQLSVAIQAVTSGGTYYSQGILNDTYMVLLGPLVELFEELNSTTQRLTPREKQVFDLYISGLPLTNIMEELRISKSTTNTHMESIRTKFGVTSNRAIITKYQITQLKRD